MRRAGPYRSKCDGLERTSAGVLRVKLDSNTLSRGSNGLKVTDGKFMSGKSLLSSVWSFSSGNWRTLTLSEAFTNFTFVAITWDNAWVGTVILRSADITTDSEIVILDSGTHHLQCKRGDSTSKMQWHSASGTGKIHTVIGLL